MDSVSCDRQETIEIKTRDSVPSATLKAKR